MKYKKVIISLTKKQYKDIIDFLKHEKTFSNISITRKVFYDKHLKFDLYEKHKVLRLKIQIEDDDRNAITTVIDNIEELSYFCIDDVINNLKYLVDINKNEVKDYQYYMKTFEMIKKYSSSKELGTSKYLFGLIAFKDFKNEKDFLEMCYGCINGSKILKNNTYLIGILNEKLSYFDISKKLNDKDILSMIDNWKSTKDIIDWYTSYLINITMLKEKWIDRVDIDLQRPYKYYFKLLKDSSKI